MKAMETTGRTVDEAVEKAIEELGINKNMVSVEVLSEPNQGLFGFLGSKNARVLVTPRYSSDEYLHQFIKELLHLMKMEGKVTLSEDEGRFYININGPDNGVLIGRRGRTLNEIQYLLNTILRRQFPGEQKRVIVDVGSYRQRREQTLSRLAEKSADKVFATRREISLEPMNPQERRIIHIALKENTKVYTYSKGDEPYRKVIIAPK
ncbi:MAG TPA: protein jag [Firmicutes bacterium]|nr:protein jag [Bacillota bacterium]